MILRYDVDLVGHARCKRNISDKLFGFSNDAIALVNGHEHASVRIVNLVLVVKELLELTAPDAAFAVDEVILGIQKLALQHVRDHGRCDYLCVRVSERSARRLAVILEYQNIFELAIAFEIDVPLPPGVHNSGDLIERLMLEINVVFGGFDGDFVSAVAGGHLKHPNAAKIYLGKDSECRELVGHDSREPANAVRWFS